VVSRARQREILADYLQLRPDQLRFEYGDLGKPRLSAAQGGKGLHFNLSNSHELALLAVASDRELGVDVEYLDRRTDGAAIARRFFAPREKQFLEQSPPAERQATFFRCWTRKEAVLKAFGVGLTFPLDRVEVSPATEERPALLSLDERLGPPDRWTLTDLRPADRYVGALAFQEGPATVRCLAWNR
jgi:4'-phosphopantetheinyl transferase